MFATLQLSEIFFVQTPYIFTLSSLDFTSSLQNNEICTVHTASYYELNKRTLKHIIDSFKIILIYTHFHDNLAIIFSLLVQSTLHHFS